MKKPQEKQPKQEVRHNNWGKWVERPRRAEIFICACGNKYLKTRPGQGVCVRCL